MPYPDNSQYPYGTGRGGNWIDNPFGFGPSQAPQPQIPQGPQARAVPDYLSSAPYDRSVGRLQSSMGASRFGSNGDILSNGPQDYSTQLRQLNAGKSATDFQTQGTLATQGQQIQGQLDLEKLRAQTEAEQAAREWMQQMQMKRMDYLNQFQQSRYDTKLKGGW